jgi:hypothetical protein
MFKSKNSLAREAAHTALADIKTRIEDHKRTRAEQLLNGADAAAIAKIDDEITGLQHATTTETDRIVLLDEAIAGEEAARVRKRQAERLALIDGKMKELRDGVADFSKTLGKAAKLYQRWQTLAVELAVMHQWRPGDQTAAGFHLDEITRDVRAELYRIGSGMPAGTGIGRPGFPGALCFKIEWQHQSEKIPALLNVIDDRLAFARKILHGASAAPSSTSAKSASAA